MKSPFTLHFDTDGTEDFAIITDAAGNDLAATHLPCTRIAERTHASGTFWRPEVGQPVPDVLNAMVLMTAAPKLLEALETMVRWAELHNLNMADLITGGQAEVPAVTFAKQAITAATDCTPYLLPYMGITGEPLDADEQPF